MVPTVITCCFFSITALEHFWFFLSRVYFLHQIYYEREKVWIIKYAEQAHVREWFCWNLFSWSTPRKTKIAKTLPLVGDLISHCPHCPLSVTRGNYWVKCSDMVESNKSWRTRTWPLSSCWFYWLAIFIAFSIFWGFITYL